MFKAYAERLSEIYDSIPQMQRTNSLYSQMEMEISKHLVTYIQRLNRFKLDIAREEIEITRSDLTDQHVFDILNELPPDMISVPGELLMKLTNNFQRNGERCEERENSGNRTLAEEVNGYSYTATITGQTMTLKIKKLY